jgi:hypothetical protein
LVDSKPGASHENPWFQLQRLKHCRTFAFSTYGRKFKPPAMRVVVDPSNLFITTVCSFDAEGGKRF